MTRDLGKLIERVEAARISDLSPALSRPQGAHKLPAMTLLVLLRSLQSEEPSNG